MWQFSFISCTLRIRCHAHIPEGCTGRRMGDLYTPIFSLYMFLKRELKFCYIEEKKNEIVGLKVSVTHCLLRLFFLICKIGIIILPCCLLSTQWDSHSEILRSEAQIVNYMGYAWMHKISFIIPVLSLLIDIWLSSSLFCRVSEIFWRL